MAVAAAAAALPFSAACGLWHPVRPGSTSLNGTWDFRLYEADIGESNEVEIASGRIEVPGCWETQGFIRPRYKRHHAKDYTGVTTRTFEWDPSWEGRRVILRFDAVYFGFDLKVNGTSFGRTGHAPNLHQFDITHALARGQNKIEVRVLTSQLPDWLFDVNDCWTLAGITRDVEIFTVGDDWIEDVTFTSDVEEGGDVRVEVQVKTHGDGEDGPAMRLLDEDGRAVWSGRGRLAGGLVRSPRLWSPESPRLYTLEVEYAGQRIRERVGLRSVRVRGFDLLVNNKPVFLKGAGLNDIDFLHGRAMTREDYEKRLRLMKAANMNFIRTVHYPLAPAFYDLCDEMGFFVCDEIPMSAQGNYKGYLDGDWLLGEMKLRAEDTIRRDKNRACVIMWSVGNENAYRPVMRDVLVHAKRQDPTRPFLFPMQAKQMMEFSKAPIPEVDIYAGHYLKMAQLDELLPRLDKPLVMTEFSHCHAEGFGNFEKTFARMLAEPKMIGGSIWCFQDQCVLTDGADAADGKMSQRNVPAQFQGVWLDGRRFLDSHGIWGSDGLVYGTMHPKAAYFLAKRLYGLERVPEAKGVRTAPAPARRGALRLCEDRPALLLPDGTAAEFVLKAGRPRGLLIRAQELVYKEAGVPFDWDPYALKARIESSAPLPGGGREYALAFSRGNDEASAETLRGTARFVPAGGGFDVAYSFSPSAECRGKFLEAGFGFMLPASFARVDWDGFGPFAAVPGKSLMDDPGVWALRSDDMRFGGNRMHVWWALLSGGASALAIEGEDMMASFEASPEGTLVAHGAIAVNYGTKLDWTPVEEAPPAAETKIEGCFRVSSAHPRSAAELTAERPFMRTYGR